MTQDCDPAKRPGAGVDGYDSLKNHPFFREIDWRDIRSKSPPILVLEKVSILCFCCYINHVFPLLR